jgi:putative PIN family toxin of toxin-antitoxin system
VKVFPDTNVLAAAVAARGLCSELLEIINHDHELLTCQAVLDELERVLAEKLRLPLPIAAGFLSLIRAEGRIIKPPRAIPRIRIKDTDDMPILACAVAGKADVFVTGDKELLDLRNVEGVVVVSPRELWHQFLGPESKPGKQSGSGWIRTNDQGIMS